MDDTEHIGPEEERLFARVADVMEGLLKPPSDVNKVFLVLAISMFALAGQFQGEAGLKGVRRICAYAEKSVRLTSGLLDSTRDGNVRN